MTHGRAACHHIARQSWWFGKSGTLLYFSYHVNVWDANEVIIIMITKEMVYLLWIFTGIRKSRGHFLKCKHQKFVDPKLLAVLLLLGYVTADCHSLEQMQQLAAIPAGSYVYGSASNERWWIGLWWLNNSHISIFSSHYNLDHYLYYRFIPKKL